MDSETRLRLHEGMLRIRLVEETIAAYYREQEMRCPVHLCSGQEAAEAGALLALRRDDYAVSGHRGHGHYLAKGGDLRAMMAEIYGKATGCASGKGGSMHLIDLDAGLLGTAPIVGSTIAIGVGAAFGSWLKGDDRVTMVCFGDGATEAGVFHESLNFAALKSLPVVFLCENNFYSVYSPLDVRQPDRTITDIVRGHGIAAERADGNDVEEVHRLTLAAVERCRRGQGPVFLEFVTYRWREHCGPNFDNDIGYRTQAEYLEWRARDPLELHRARLLADGIASAGRLDAMAGAIQDEVNGAIAFAKQSPFPARETAAMHVYAEDPRT
jgi:pyruvate dehydrogenase E1 component alpha subunit